MDLGPNGVLSPTLGHSLIVFRDEKKLAFEGRIAECGARLSTLPPKVSVPDRIVCHLDSRTFARFEFYRERESSPDTSIGQFRR